MQILSTTALPDYALLDFGDSQRPEKGLQWLFARPVPILSTLVFPEQHLP